MLLSPELRRPEEYETRRRGYHVDAYQDIAAPSFMDSTGTGVSDEDADLLDTAVAHTVGVVRADDGLRLSLGVPRGPYFRDELLPVTLALTNSCIASTRCPVWCLAVSPVLPSRRYRPARSACAGKHGARARVRQAGLAAGKQRRYGMVKV